MFWEWIAMIPIAAVLAYIGWHLAVDPDDAAAVYGQPEDDTEGDAHAVAEMRQMERRQLVQQAAETGEPPLNKLEQLFDAEDEEFRAMVARMRGRSE